jgi:fructose-1,6-bisphosphatase/inositol monophosphatase family enzyme
MPRRNRCYVATKGEGAYLLSREDIAAGRSGVRCDVTRGDGPALLFNSPDLVEKLSRSMVAKDIATAYLDEPGKYYSTDLLEGRACAMVFRSCQAIDCASLAFIAAESGAIVSHFSGEEVGSYRKAPSRVLPDVVVAVNREAHQKVLRALQG